MKILLDIRHIFSEISDDNLITTKVSSFVIQKGY